jgi:hypothetical protein
LSRLPPVSKIFKGYPRPKRSSEAESGLTSDTSDSVNDIVDHFLANGIVAASVVVGSILLAADQQFRVEELAVITSADFIDRRGVEVDKDGSRDVFAVAGLGEEGLKRSSIANVLGIGVRATVRAKAMLEEVPR